MRKKIVRVLYLVAVLLITILLFGLGDYLIHGLSEKWSVPDYYFKNKIIYGFLWGMVAWMIFGRMKKLWIRAGAFSAAVVVLLQAKYFLEGYPLDFVIIFLFIHFAILYPLAAGMFYLAKKS